MYWNNYFLINCAIFTCSVVGNLNDWSLVLKSIPVNGNLPNKYSKLVENSNHGQNQVMALIQQAIVSDYPPTKDYNVDYRQQWQPLLAPPPPTPAPIPPPPPPLFNDENDEDDDDDYNIHESSIESQQRQSIILAIALSISIPALVIIIIGAVCRWCFYRRKKADKSTIIAAVNTDDAQKNHKNEYVCVGDEWTIDDSCLTIFYDQKIGSGAFSNVYKGKLAGVAPICRVHPSLDTKTYTNCLVAVKLLPPFVDSMGIADFVQEINFMKTLGVHPNLIRLIGTSSHQHLVSSPNHRLVVEYCENGDLLHLIRRRRQEMISQRNVDGTINDHTTNEPLQPIELITYAWQISCGLSYLHRIDCIHRDIAARNILVDGSNTAKISDFGLCRLIDRQLYSSRGGRLPIKWMALESLRSYEYSFKTDIWSYGVLLFELYSLGDVPYAWLQPSDMIGYLCTGERLDRPSICPDNIYSIMRQCWSERSQLRPTADQIGAELARIITESNMRSTTD